MNDNGYGGNFKDPSFPTRLTGSTLSFAFLFGKKTAWSERLLKHTKVYDVSKWCALKAQYMFGLDI